MEQKILSKNGLVYLIAKFRETFASSSQGEKADSAVQSVKVGSTEYKSGTEVTLPEYPTTLPANGGNADTVNNHTVNSDVPENAVFTDTDTWRGIQNNLTSTSTTDSLSAYQGKLLKDLIDGEVITESDIATLF